MKPIVAHFGAFDHDSFGDLIFPHLIERALPQFDFVHVSPYGEATPFADARATISIREALARADFAAVVLGGGDLITCPPWSPPAWAAHETVRGATISMLWASSSLLASRRGIPLVWNSPGAPLESCARKLRSVRELVKVADYASVRDVFSQKRLKKLGVQASLSPDSAVLLSELWPADEAVARRINLCWSMDDARCRKGSVQQAIRQLRDRGYELSALPLMRYQRPGAVARDLEVRPCASLRELARTIGSAEGYVGNSLHGLISALAYGRRAVVVPPFGIGYPNKYAGFLLACGLNPEHCLAADWDSAVALLERQAPQDLTFARARVRANYEAIAQAIAGGVRPRAKLHRVERAYARVLVPDAPGIVADLRSLAGRVVRRVRRKSGVSGAVR